MFNSFLTELFLFLFAFSFLVSIQFKNKPKIILSICFSYVFFIIHCLFLGAYVGAVVTIVNMVRLLFIYNIEKKEKKEKIKKTKTKMVGAFIFLVLFLISSIATWEAWYAIFAFLPPFLMTIIYFSKNLFIIKFSFIIEAFLWGSYLLLASSYTGFIAEILIGIGAIYSFIRYVKFKDESSKIKRPFKKTSLG